MIPLNVLNCGSLRFISSPSKHNDKATFDFEFCLWKRHVPFCQSTSWLSTVGSEYHIFFQVNSILSIMTNSKSVISSVKQSMQSFSSDSPDNLLWSNFLNNMNHYSFILLQALIHCSFNTCYYFQQVNSFFPGTSETVHLDVIICSVHIMQFFFKPSFLFASCNCL